MRPSLRVHIARYLAAKEAQNYAKTTLVQRRQQLGRFANWCEERGLDDAAEITKPILDRYQRWLCRRRKPNGEPLSFRTQHTQLVAIRALFRWLVRQNELLWNPASELELPKIEAKLPKHVLTVSEAEEVLSQAHPTEPFGLRDRAILETFYSTGMRRAELIKLEVYDLDFQRETVTIRQGKGGKDRVVPIGERALRWIARYRDELRPAQLVNPKEKTLFLNGDGGRFSAPSMSGLVRKYVLAADLGKGGSCHLFRHTMATLMLENGADIRFIQQILGHANLETTEIYTRVAIRKLKEVHRRTHPARMERTRELDDGDDDGEGVDDSEREPDKEPRR